MKEKQDYYVPTIEEFYHGFEFEIKTLDTEETWIKDVFGKYDYDYVQIDDWVNLKGVRVKYLDREDIESFGFVYDHTSRDRQWVFYKGNLCLFYYPKSKELGTFTRDPTKSNFMMKYSRDNHMVSTLLVKNKSELKIILKQLNIL